MLAALWPVPVGESIRAMNVTFVASIGYAALNSDSHTRNSLSGAEFGRKGCVVLQGERVAVVTQGPWLGRDGFVAETAVQFDRVNAAIARLERETEKARQTIAEMVEESNRTRRFQAFEETLKNSRDYKITDLQRGFRDLKSRLDAIEGERSTFAGLSYKSFEAIDKKLAELSALQAQFETSEQNVHRNTMLVCAAGALAVIGMASLLF